MEFEYADNETNTETFCECGNEIKQYPEGDDTMTICEDCR